ncbi:D-isomer-specific 2-hydroxyacid dehydrogenase-like protein [Hyaloscypha variabilis F]|uniref:D-isomer-specific 2-hydroxyacid dehydrogenase-like protein n=1 Tax=Hyaloscypha variabilis (strain UAMH 11265 / GT02V1 / F) TaxID=1149755 RepID=A0A2J6RFI4_HYAVF|nr:D-isomer-specific 2-hydroxyacid dehydrogenase-like protein [Hyaloscypha variabilis F]
MASTAASGNGSKPIVLHIGDPVKWNTAFYDIFSKDFTVVRPSLEERQRDAFMKGLKEGKWGNFSAIFRPFWNTGGEMGRWDKEMVPLIPKSCKIFASAGAGFDWADVDILAERGIVYCNSAAASTEAVADFAIFLILATFRNLNWCTTAARSSEADFTYCHQNTAALSHNPRGNNLGIIGLGNIGFEIARKAYLAFGMKIKYFDVIRKSKEKEAEIEAEFFTDLNAMLAISDCVVLATPASPDGKKLINKERLSKMKKGSRFVNIARGVLVDEEALADAVEDGTLVGVGLDVHEFEPKINPRLKALRQVNLTSHNAGGTLETHMGFEELAMRNIDAVLKGNEPLTPVNKHLIVVPASKIGKVKL